MQHVHFTAVDELTKLKEIAESKGFQEPLEVREFPLGRLELIKLGTSIIGRAVFQPGWRWCDSVQPLVGTSSCDAPHLQYHISGVMHVLMDDGTEFDCHPGEVSFLPSGHDAWTVGDEPAVVIDFQGMLDYAEARQKQAEKSLQRVIVESPLPMLIHNVSENEESIDLNRRFLECFRFEQKTATSLADWAEAIFPVAKYRDQILASWEERAASSAEGGTAIEPLRIEAGSPTGESRLFDVHLTRADQQTVAVFVDCTDQQRTQAELEHTSTHDSLTSLLNRRGFEQQVEQVCNSQVADGTSFGLIAIDIDCFKQFNDRYGHAAGDECLSQVAEALRRLSGAEDTVARIGGEEFLVLLPSADDRYLERCAERLRQGVESLGISHEGSVAGPVVTISVGTSTALPTEGAEGVQSAYEVADNGLYQSKEGGRNRVTSGSIPSQSDVHSPATPVTHIRADRAG